MSRAKVLLSKLWKAVPRSLRWRTMWLLSDRFVVGVTGVVLNARGEVLLAHHVYRDRVVWGLPGGLIQRGESLEEALHREIREETGIDVQVGHLLQVALDERWPNVTCHFLCTVDGTPQPRVSDELFEAGFYPLDDLPGPVDPGQQAIIQRGLRVREQPELAQIIPTGVNRDPTAKDAKEGPR